MAGKSTKRPHTEFDSDCEKENFPRFIILESEDDIPLTKLSPFVIEKVISTNITPKTVKNLRNGTILVEVEKKRYADTLLKMKNFHNKKIKSYPHGKMNMSKGVVRSRELSSCTIEEIKTELKSQGLIDIKRVSIKKNEKIIETNTYIMTFNTPKAPKEIKIGYIIEKIDLFIPNPLRCHNCQKFGHHEDACHNRPVCGRCSQKNPDHTTNECTNRSNCANCGEEHPAYARICDIWKKEKEIISVKQKQNISFPEARRIVDSYMREKSYAQTTKIKENTEKNDKYDALIKKLLNLGPNDWPKFINEIKPTIRNITNTNTYPEINQNQKTTKTSDKTKIEQPQIPGTSGTKQPLAQERKNKKDNEETTKIERPQIPGTSGTKQPLAQERTNKKDNKETLTKHEPKPLNTTSRPRSRSKTKTKNKQEYIEFMDVDTNNPNLEKET